MKLPSTRPNISGRRYCTFSAFGGLPHLISNEPEIPKTSPERMINALGVSNRRNVLSSVPNYSEAEGFFDKEPRSSPQRNSCPVRHCSHPLSTKNNNHRLCDYLYLYHSEASFVKPYIWIPRIIERLASISS